MFDSKLSHFLRDRIVDGAHQVYIGIDNATGAPALAVPCVMHGMVGARYFELTKAEFAEASKDLFRWYEKNASRFAAAQ